MKVFVVHVYDAADRLHDFYVHGTPEVAVRQAAIDLVAGRFEDADPDFFLSEVNRVVAEADFERPTGRRHVRCDSWHAHVDEMRVRG